MPGDCLPVLGRETARVVKNIAMSPEQIERAMEDAGWRVDSGFAAYLIAGCDGHVSVLAPRWVWELEDPVGAATWLAFS